MTMTKSKDIETVRGGKTGTVYTIWTVSVGQCFATAGQLRVGRKVVAETDPLPYGFTGPARAQARDLAEQL